MISPLIYYSYNILINHNNPSVHKSSYHVALVKATQKDHAQPKYLPNIVMGLDTNPTVSHLDISSNYNVSTIRLAIVALKDAVEL